MCCHEWYAEVVKILLRRGDVDLNESDNEGKTPLLYAAQNGHAEVVKTLLRKTNTDPNEPDYAGQAPLVGYREWPRGSSEITTRTG